MFQFKMGSDKSWVLHCSTLLKMCKHLMDLCMFSGNKSFSTFCIFALKLYTKYFLSDTSSNEITTQACS